MNKKNVSPSVENRYLMADTYAIVKISKIQINNNKYPTS